jgi:hypothetical protein
MATPQVLLIDDDPRMEALLRDQVGLPAHLLVRDPSGIFEPEPGKHGLVLLNAEFQKSFGLCRRFKKKRETAAVPIAFFTLSHEREHLRILAEHRALPTHADHYLLPPVTAERVADLLARTVGVFEHDLPAPAAAAPRPPDADDDDHGFDEVEPHEPTHQDVSAVPAPEPAADDDEFVVAPAADEALPPTPVLTEFQGVTGEVPIQGEPSLGGFQADRMTSVERYVSKLHGEFVRMEDEIESSRAERDAERARLLVERDTAVQERDAVRAELERATSELATLRGDAEFARAEAEQAQAEIRRLRADAERLLAETDRSRGETERHRTEVNALAERVRRAEAALAEAQVSAQVEATRTGALIASLEASVVRANNRLGVISRTLRAARPSMATLVELARELDLEGVGDVDADGVPAGLDDH